MLRKLSQFILVGFTFFNFVLTALADTDTEIERKSNISNINKTGEVTIMAGLSENPPAKVIDAVKQELSKMLNVESDQLKLEKATRRSWSNGCLGLAKPDEFCSQAIVEGWQVMMSYQNKTWTYRTNSTGSNIRLETK